VAKLQAEHPDISLRNLRYLRLRMVIGPDPAE
jgi:hypothetical protein